jgi:transcriptional regulator with PAS, ATPase and Fis domain
MERKEDIIEISNYYIERFNMKFGKHIKQLGSIELKELLAYQWPGNIRELRNFIEKQMVFAESDVLDLSELKVRGLSSPNRHKAYKEYIEGAEREYIEKIYKQRNGRVDEVAEAIEMSVPFVYKKLKEHGIS